MSIDDRDLFDDEDMLDFEDPAHRETARLRMGTPRPTTVSAARILMYLQAASPVLLPIVLIATGGGGGDEATTTTTTTTAPVFAGAAAGETQRRGGGAGLIILVFFLAMIVALIVAAARLAKLTSSARVLALSLEGLLLLGGLAMSVRGSVPGMVLTASAIAVVGLLLAPATKNAIAHAATADSSARFDVRNLPTLDR